MRSRGFVVAIVFRAVAGNLTHRDGSNRAKATVK
jgi:hypothetical protein